jgi:hypothetical protein
MILSLVPEAKEVYRHDVPFFDFPGLWLYMTCISHKDPMKRYLHVGFNDGKLMGDFPGLEKGNRTAVKVYRLPSVWTDEDVEQFQQLVLYAKVIREQKNALIRSHR